MILEKEEEKMQEEKPNEAWIQVKYVSYRRKTQHFVEWMYVIK